jgi:hypothetical protein
MPVLSANTLKFLDALDDYNNVLERLWSHDLVEEREAVLYALGAWVDRDGYWRAKDDENADFQPEFYRGLND